MKKWKFMGLIVVLMLITSTTIYAVTTLYDAVEVEYDNSSSGTEETDVQGAIDELYGLVGKCPDGYVCEKIPDPLLPEIESHLCNDNVTSECYKKEGTEYIYMGAAGTEGNNWLWYGGHQWRIIKVDTTSNTYTLITSYPVTTIHWQSSILNGPSLEESYVGDWLNNVFVASLPSKVQSRLEKMTYTRNIYNGSSVVSEEISNVKARLLTEAEYTNYGGANTYLDMEDDFLLADIYSSSNVRLVTSNGELYYSSPLYARGVRPIIEVSNLTFTEGGGTLTNPYIASTSKATMVQEMVVGEYVSIPKSDGTSYLARVVKHDQDGTKVILNGLWSSASVFGNSTTFSTNSTIYIEALTNFKTSLDSTYFDRTSRTYNMTQYESGANYANNTTQFTGHIALASVGEMFSGNDIDLSNSSVKTFVDITKIENPTVSSYYWSINAFNSSYVDNVNYNGNLNYSSPTSSYGVRPVWYLSNLTIVGGNGTANDPYRLK